MTRMEQIRELLEQAIVLTYPETPPSQWVRPEPKERPEWTQMPTEFNKVTYVGPLEAVKTFDEAANIIKSAKGGDAILFERGNTFEATGTKFVGKKDSAVYIGAYGEGADPIIKVTGGFMYEGVSNYYYHNLHFIGEGYDNGAPECFRLWDNIQYMVFNKCTVEEFGLGFNISEGRGNPEMLNTHIAILDCTGRWNRSGFTYGGFPRHTWIDGNLAEYNGGYGGAHNYYLSGEWKTETQDYVFQNNISRHNAPRNGKDGGGRSRGGIVAHGYIDRLYYVNNIDEEIKGTSEHGGWGHALDEGRPPEWGAESFPNLVCCGNIAKYTGNLCFSLTNCDEALVGWNEAWVEPSLDGRGFQIPGKASEDPETAIKKLTFVHNKVYTTERLKADAFIIADHIELVDEHNEVIIT